MLLWYVIVVIELVFSSRQYEGMLFHVLSPISPLNKLGHIHGLGLVETIISPFVKHFKIIGSVNCTNLYIILLKIIVQISYLALFHYLTKALTVSLLPGHMH